MNVIFAISPQYLKAIFNESEKYDFAIQGYGNLADAKKGLLYTNIFDILGFAYVADTLPKSLGNFLNFLSILDKMCSKTPKTFLFALRSNANLEKVTNRKKFKNLVFKYIPDIEVFTDVIINKGIFGTILTDNFQPYYIKIPDLKSEDHDIQCLNYKPIFTKYMLEIFEPPVLLSTSDDTVSVDKFVKDTAKFNKYLTTLRVLYIKFLFREDIKDDLDRFEELLHGISSVNEFCNYSALVQCLRDSIEEREVSDELENDLESST